MDTWPSITALSLNDMIHRKARGATKNATIHSVPGAASVQKTARFSFHSSKARRHSRSRARLSPYFSSPLPYSSPALRERKGPIAQRWEGEGECPFCPTILAAPHPPHALRARVPSLSPKGEREKQGEKEKSSHAAWM